MVSGPAGDRKWTMRGTGWPMPAVQWRSVVRELCRVGSDPGAPPVRPCFQCTGAPGMEVCPGALLMELDRARLSGRRRVDFERGSWQGHGRCRGRSRVHCRPWSSLARWTPAGEIFRCCEAVTCTHPHQLVKVHSRMLFHG